MASVQNDDDDDNDDRQRATQGRVGGQGGVKLVIEAKTRAEEQSKR